MERHRTARTRCVGEQTAALVARHRLGIRRRHPIELTLEKTGVRRRDRNERSTHSSAPCGRVGKRLAEPFDEWRQRDTFSWRRERLDPELYEVRELAGPEDHSVRKSRDRR